MSFGETPEQTTIRLKADFIAAQTQWRDAAMRFIHMPDVHSIRKMTEHMEAYQRAFMTYHSQKQLGGDW